ncbi:mycothiol transferase [Aestuariimicrobium kwangyangense]|uniref:mycothiol transferase n=1 Tax=Aestuariimicrobium kwangyangense TaxID=396389 RepID=UPI0003B35F10|nr:DinB family protein [Aestuariimicrobium kwangyangense]
MDAFAVLADAAHRPVDSANALVRGLDLDALHARPDGKGNSIAWLIWHAGRQLDSQVAELTGREQVWHTGDWARRTGIHRDDQESGFGDDDGDVESLRVSDPSVLPAYLSDAVASLLHHLDEIDESALDDVVDTRWDPPVTRGVRLVSVIDDAVAHVAQAQYVRGIVADWSIGY